MLVQLMLRAGSAACRCPLDTLKTSIKAAWFRGRFLFPGRDRQMSSFWVIQYLVRINVEHYRTAMMQVLYGSTIPVRATYRSIVSRLMIILRYPAARCLTSGVP